MIKVNQEQYQTVFSRLNPRLSTVKLANTTLYQSVCEYAQVRLNPADLLAPYYAVIPGYAAFPPRRQREFLAGRICAAHALQTFLGKNDIYWLSRQADGAPNWPAGIAGSLSHTRQIAMALVAKQSPQLATVGVDIEPVMSTSKAHVLGPTILALSTPRLHGELPFAALVTLVFSAKESLFKALQPHGIHLPLSAIRCTAIDCAAGLCQLEVEAKLAFHHGAPFEIHFRFADDLTHVITYALT